MQNVVEKKKCLFCGREINGRIDKKYCDDICRNNYNYQRNKPNDTIIKEVNKSLACNRKILHLFCRNEKTVVKRQLLVDNNFDFSLMTGIYKTKKCQEYRLLYDYAYKNIDDDHVLVIKYRK